MERNNIGEKSLNKNMREKLHATVINFPRVRKIQKFGYQFAKRYFIFFILELNECIHVTENMKLVMFLSSLFLYIICSRSTISILISYLSNLRKHLFLTITVHIFIGYLHVI